MKDYDRNSLGKTYAEIDEILGRDGKVQRLESLLNRFIVALFECAVNKRSARIEREEAEVLRMAESRRKGELRKLQEQERTRLAQLLKDVEAWH